MNTTDDNSTLRRIMGELGRRSRQNLTPEERTALGRKGAKGRWRGKTKAQRREAMAKIRAARGKNRPSPAGID